MTNLNLNKTEKEHLIGTLTERLTYLWKDIKVKREMINNLDSSDSNRIEVLDKLVMEAEAQYLETLDTIAKLMERE